MSLGLPFDRARSARQALLAVAYIVASVAAGACGLDVVGSASGIGADGGGGALAAALDAGAGGDASPAPGPGLGPQLTCRDLLALAPGTASGVALVDPDGPGGAPAFEVRCDMITLGGGWTLVGRELAGVEGTLQFLAADTGNPSELAAGIQSGLLGSRFIGKYTQVWIDWDTSKFVRFTRPASFDLFANGYHPGVLVKDPTTSEKDLESWFDWGGGAQICVASRKNDLRPGETSWAVKPAGDNSAQCGCSGPVAYGRGAYYGGAKMDRTTLYNCAQLGGGWAGAKDYYQKKGGIVPAYETRIWIR